MYENSVLIKMFGSEREEEREYCRKLCSKELRDLYYLKKFQMVSLEFFIDIKSFRSHYGPGVDSASNRNEYQEHFLGVKAAGA